MEWYARRSACAAIVVQVSVALGSYRSAAYCGVTEAVEGVAADAEDRGRPASTLMFMCVRGVRAAERTADPRRSRGDPGWIACGTRRVVRGRSGDPGRGPSSTYKARTGPRGAAKDVEAVAGSASRSSAASCSGCSGRTAPARPRRSRCSSRCCCPPAGTARVLGHDVVAETPRGAPAGRLRLRRRPGLYERLSGLDNLRYFAELYGVPGARAAGRIGELLELVGLTGREQERVEGYSRGMRQRLHIARGLLHRPEVLFLDEPSIGIDPVGARELRTTVADLVEQGTTVLLTTHYMFEADELCDRIAVIAGGRIVAEGTPDRAQAAGRRRAASSRSRSSGVPDDAVAAVRAAARRASVVVEERGQAQVLVVRAEPGAEVTRPVLGLPGRRPARPGRHPRADAGGRVRRAGRRRVRTAVSATLRLIAVGWWLQLKMRSRSAFDGLLGDHVPAVLRHHGASSCTGRAATRPALVSAAVGASVMGVWSAVSTTAASSLQQRAPAGHPRAAGRRADAVPAARRADHAGDGDDRRSTAWSRPCCGGGSCSASRSRIDQPLVFVARGRW